MISYTLAMWHSIIIISDGQVISLEILHFHFPKELSVGLTIIGNTYTDMKYQ